MTEQSAASCGRYHLPHIIYEALAVNIHAGAERVLKMRRAGYPPAERDSLIASRKELSAVLLDRHGADLTYYFLALDIYQCI